VTGARRPGAGDQPGGPRGRGEVVWTVPALDVPAEDATTVEEVLAAPAVRLLVDRARQVVPGFALGPDDAPLAGTLVRRLDGIPLAIELAAARLRVLSLPEVVEGLADRFALLRSRDRHAPSRQRTLRGALDWSHDLLDDDQRLAWAALSVPSGWFDRHLAAALLDAVGTEAGPAGPRSPSWPTGPCSPSTPRHARRATGCSRPSGRTAVSGSRTCRAATRCTRGTPTRWRRRSCRPPQRRRGGVRRRPRGAGTWSDEARGALQWAEQAGDRPRVQRLAGLLGWHWLLQGLATEGLAWLERGLAVGSRVGRPGRGSSGPRRRRRVRGGAPRAGREDGRVRGPAACLGAGRGAVGRLAARLPAGRRCTGQTAGRAGRQLPPGGGGGARRAHRRGRRVGSHPRDRSGHRHAAGLRRVRTGGRARRGGTRAVPGPAPARARVEDAPAARQRPAGTGRSRAGAPPPRPRGPTGHPDRARCRVRLRAGHGRLVGPPAGGPGRGPRAPQRSARRARHVTADGVRGGVGSPRAQRGRRGEWRPRPRRGGGHHGARVGPRRRTAGPGRPGARGHGRREHGRAGGDHGGRHRCRFGGRAAGRRPSAASASRRRDHRAVGAAGRRPRRRRGASAAGTGPVRGALGDAGGTDRGRPCRRVEVGRRRVPHAQYHFVGSSPGS
jgi:hypothetical protein